MNANFFAAGKAIANFCLFQGLRLWMRVSEWSEVSQFQRECYSHFHVEITSGPVCCDEPWYIAVFPNDLQCSSASRNAIFFPHVLCSIVMLLSFLLSISARWIILGFSSYPAGPMHAVLNDCRIKRAIRTPNLFMIRIAFASSKLRLHESRKPRSVCPPN